MNNAHYMYYRALEVQRDLRREAANERLVRHANTGRLRLGRGIWRSARA
jgi:hypothetical protein